MFSGETLGCDVINSISMENLFHRYHCNKSQLFGVHFVSTENITCHKNLSE